MGFGHEKPDVYCVDEVHEAYEAGPVDTDPDSDFDPEKRENPQHSRRLR